MYVRIPGSAHYLTKISQCRACGDIHYPPQTGPSDAVLEQIELQRLEDESAAKKVERARERKKEVASLKRERQIIDMIAKGKRPLTDPRGGQSSSSVSNCALLLTGD